MEKMLPKWWEVVKSDLITDITDYVANGSFQSLSENVKTYDSEEYAILLRLKDFNNNFKNALKYVDEKSYKFLSKSEINEGDLFISNVGNPGICYLVPNLGKPVTLGPNGIRLRVNKYGNTLFIKYYLQSPQGKKEINAITTGTAQLKFNKTDFRNLIFPLPPLAEQARIVAKLDALFAQHEIMKKALERIPKLLKDFRQQVLTQAVTGKLTEQWRKGKSLLEWKIDIIKNITSKLGSGSTPRGGSDTYLAEGIPLVRSMNIVFGGIKLHGLAFINESQAKALRNSEIQFEDILLNITGASIGRLCLADKIVTGGRVNQHVFIIRPWTEIVLPKYLESYLCSNLIQRFIEEKKYGAGMEAISKNQIENFEINLPPLQEQQEIVCRIESLFGKADAIEVRYIKLKEKITSLPQALLHKAFKGELVPQLPTDGDAKELLAEILALKKDVKGKKK